jgi:hypothetical protein
MKDDDLTQLMLVRPPRRAGAATGPSSFAEQPSAIASPRVGSQSAGETFFGDTDVGADAAVPKAGSTAKRREKSGDAPPSRPHQRSSPAPSAPAFGVRRAVVCAALAGIALGLGLSLRAREQTALAPSLAPTTLKETQSTIQDDGVLTPPSISDAAASRAPLVQVFPFEMSEHEAQWAEQAHAAAQRGSCPEALQLYQRLVDLSAATKETRVEGMSRWWPFLEQMRRRCFPDPAPNPHSQGAP